MKQELEATTAKLAKLETAEKTEPETNTTEIAREDSKESAKGLKLSPSELPNPLSSSSTSLSVSPRSKMSLSSLRYTSGERHPS